MASGGAPVSRSLDGPNANIALVKCYGQTLSGTPPHDTQTATALVTATLRCLTQADLPADDRLTSFRIDHVGIVAEPPSLPALPSDFFLAEVVYDVLPVVPGTWLAGNGSPPDREGWIHGKEEFVTIACRGPNCTEVGFATSP